MPIINRTVAAIFFAGMLLAGGPAAAQNVGGGIDNANGVGGSVISGTTPCTGCTAGNLLGVGAGPVVVDSGISATNPLFTTLRVSPLASATNSITFGADPVQDGSTLWGTALIRAGANLTRATNIGNNSYDEFMVVLQSNQQTTNTSFGYFKGPLYLGAVTYDSSTASIIHSSNALTAYSEIATGISNGYAEGAVVTAQGDGTGTGILIAGEFDIFPGASDSATNVHCDISGASDCHTNIWLANFSSTVAGSWMIDSNIGGAGWLNGISLRDVASGGMAIEIPNATYFSARNALNDADLNLFRLDSNNYFQIIPSVLSLGASAPFLGANATYITTNNSVASGIAMQVGGVTHGYIQAVDGVFQINASSTYGLEFTTQNTNVVGMIIYSSGGVFIGSANFADPGVNNLAVSGTVSASLAQTTEGNMVCYNSTSGLFTYSTIAQQCTVSSARYKEGITSLLNERSLQIALSLQPISFNYKPEMDLGSERHLGFLAEQVAAIAPELAIYDDAGRPNAIKQTELNPIVFGAIQALNEKIKALEAKVH